MQAEQGGPHDIYALAGHGPVGRTNAVPAVTHSEAAALWRSRQKPGSSLGSFGKAIGIVVGGFLGVGVAYFFLSLISPSKFDFLHLWGRPNPNANPPANAVAPGSPESKVSKPTLRDSGEFDPNNPSFTDLEKGRSPGPGKTR